MPAAQNRRFASKRGSIGAPEVAASSPDGNRHTPAGKLRDFRGTGTLSAVFARCFSFGPLLFYFSGGIVYGWLGVGLGSVWDGGVCGADGAAPVRFGPTAAVLVELCFRDGSRLGLVLVYGWLV